ncbi:MAG: glycosyltransferase family 4 protein [Clostridiaceae bacterium]|nr:glycosyltransferase family 4 protein [Clostridiaceae bacterium]
MFFELIYIIKLKKHNQRNILLSVRTSFLNTIFYFIISRLLGYTYLIDINELHSFKKQASLIKKYNHYLFDNYSNYLCDGIISISSMITNFYSSKIKKTPIVQIPVITDIERIMSIKPINLGYDFILYCASAAYYETASFILQAYSNGNYNFKMVFILNGSKNEIDKVINASIKLNIQKNLTILSNLDYNELIGHYKGAKALVVPLPETFDHMARFPHKIGEYCASKRPIITNSYGEIKTYFSSSNSIIADNYSINEFSKLFQIVNDNSYNPEITQKAFELAQQMFSYKNVFNKLQILIK